MLGKVKNTKTPGANKNWFKRGFYVSLLMYYVIVSQVLYILA